MIIRLQEIPKEGKSFEITRISGELNEDLQDLIGNTQPYCVKMEFLPVGQAYDLSGKLQAQLSETCSFCAQEFDLKISEKFHELILKDETKKLKGLSDISTQEEMSVSVANPDLTYNLGALIREIVALAEPLQPSCKPDCKGLCKICGANLNENSCRCAEEKTTKESPFSVLKTLKLN